MGASFGFLTAMPYVTVVYEGIPKTSYALWIHYYILVAFIFDVLVMVVVAAAHCMAHGFMKPSNEEDGAEPIKDEDKDRRKRARAIKTEQEKERLQRQENNVWWTVTISRVAIPLLFVVADAILFVIVFNYKSFEFAGQTA